MTYTPEQAAKEHNDRIQPQIASMIGAIVEGLEAARWGDAEAIVLGIKVSAPDSVVNHAIAEVQDMGWDIKRSPCNPYGVFVNVELHVRRPSGAIKLRRPGSPSRFSLWMARLAHKLHPQTR